MTSLKYDLGPFSSKVVAFLYLSIAAEIAYLSFIIMRLQYFYAFGDPDIEYEAFTAMANRIDSISLYVVVAYFIIFVLTVIFVGIWIYRASNNAAQLRPMKERIRPGWAVGWNFIPIASLWMPYRAIGEIWNSRPGFSGPLNTPLPGYALLWWLCWVFSNILSQISFRLSGSDDVDTLKLSDTIDLISVPLSILAAFLLARLIKQITQSQAGATVPIAPVEPETPE